MNQQSDRMDVKLLIMKVKENRAIYDASHINHRSRCFIASVWRKIADDLCVSEDKVKKKWHQLRSNYMRAKKTAKNYPGKAKNKWAFYDLMTFLDEPPLQPPILYDERGTYEDELQENVSTSVIITEYGSVVNDPETSNSTPYSNKIFTRIKESPPEDDIEPPFLSELNEISSSRPDENDPDRLFLLSLLPSIKQLSPADNIDFKVYTLQFLKSKLRPN